MIPQRSHNKRQTDRVALHVPVKLLIDDVQYEGEVIDVSLSGVSVNCNVRPAIGAKVIAYVEGITRFEGTAARLFKGGFAFSYDLPQMKRERVARKLAELSGQPLPFEAAAPQPKPKTVESDERLVRFADGREGICRILDASVVGLTLLSQHRPPVASEVIVNDNPAKVVRHTRDGFVVEFTRYWQAVASRSW
ncbi:PilZ domain-containing protein [Parvularcula dongshanensis]|uniref:PilZ domain-containing protein n=1 Tax=Parvularcula dongshanensis TaxID=1173995 RepID=A0A840I804_9PROT|nr:PilZ domain-containing protein [Parvularcula dongshanensis]MBB4660090.1 hypothetical protein [Parvularcula dongshanensis]